MHIKETRMTYHVMYNMKSFELSLESESQTHLIYEQE